jgi:hypothetical protein
VPRPGRDHFGGQSGLNLTRSQSSSSIGPRIKGQWPVKCRKQPDSPALNHISNAATCRHRCACCAAGASQTSLQPRLSRDAGGRKFHRCTPILFLPVLDASAHWPLIFVQLFVLLVAPLRGATTTQPCTLEVLTACTATARPRMFSPARARWQVLDKIMSISYRLSAPRPPPNGCGATGEPSAT